MKVKIASEPTQLKITTNTIITTSGTPYEGEYNVTPKVDEAVTLETQNKTMSQDVTIQKIPQYLVSNDEGGKTLIIGEEYYYA